MGQGPLILCSELPLSPFARFEPLQRKLAEHFRVCVFDLRPVVGHSAYHPPADDLLDYLSDFFLTLAKMFGAEQFSLIGSFMFGAVALDIARKAPRTVRSLVLVGSLGILRLPITPLLWVITTFFRIPGLPVLYRVAPVRAVIEWSDHYVIGPWRMREIFRDPKRAPVTIEDLYEQHKRPRNVEAALTLMWTIRNLTYETLVPRFAEISCPSLIVHGAEDQWIPLRYAEQLRSRLPNASLAVIPCTRHAPELENVEMTSTSIEKFLEKNATAGL